MTQTTLPTLAELCEKYQLDDEVLWDIANTSNISKSIIDTMTIGIQVEREEAERVLAALSQLTGTTWTRENTAIPYVGEVPTFQRLCQRHQIDAGRLSTQSGVPIAIMDQMLVGHPVGRGDARNVLAMLSRIAGKNYHFANVDVKLNATRGTP